MLRTALLTSFTALTFVACSKDEPAKPLAPPVQSPLEAAKPATPQAKKLTIAPDASKVTWTMDAPLEKIYGEVPGGVTGELFVDPMDPSKTTGNVHVDLSKLVLHQEKREDEKKEYGTRETNAMQNDHARAWLEIGKDAPEEMRKANEKVELKLTSVTATGGADLSQMTGDERKFRAMATGDFVLHGRKSPKTVEVEVTMKLSGNELKEVHVKSVKPMTVSLDEHDVRPREAFGKLAAKTLEAMGSKVASQAPIDIEIVAR